MDLMSMRCPECESEKLKVHSTYFVQGGQEARRMWRCAECRCQFSQTYGTALAGLRTALSRIQTILNALNDGMGVNAACRTFAVSKNTLKGWQTRLAGLKESLMLYALCHQFLSQWVEGDELYTKVKANVPPMEAEGWTVVLLERSSRFVWELHCGAKDRTLFEKAMQTLAQVIQQTRDLTLLTDGERRYGSVLFDICRTVLRTAKSVALSTACPRACACA